MTEDRANMPKTILDPQSSILNLRSSVAVWMWMLLVMLSEEVLTVIVPVRSSDDGVNVLPIYRLRIRSAAPQADRQLMIEFDQYHRALDAVIKNAFRLDSADPGEASVLNLPPDFVHLHFRVFVPHIPDVFPDQVEQLHFLFGRKFRRANPGVIEDDIVLEGFAHVVVAGLGDLDDRLLALRVIERIDHRQSLVLLVLQNERSFVFAGMGDDWLGACEGRGHDHLIAQHEIVDDQMVSVELPSPRLLVRGLAHHRDPVEPFAVLL